MFTMDTYFGGKFAERHNKHGQIGAKGDTMDKEVPRGSLGMTSHHMGSKRQVSSARPVREMMRSGRKTG
jgi:hypothetical protein